MQPEEAGVHINCHEIVKFLAKRFEISKREVQQYIDSGQVDISNIKAALK